MHVILKTLDNSILINATEIVFPNTSFY